MAFSDYKSISQVQQEYQIRYAEAHFIDAKRAAVSSIFQAEFDFSLEHIDVFTSEAARSESVIFPILREAYKPHKDKFSFWIQKSIQFNAVLSGTPDYLFGTKSKLGKTVLEFPLVLIAEAKKNDFEQGWGQCLIELITAQKLNNDSQKIVYGIVTDGKLWEFARLQEQVFTKHSQSYTIDDLPLLFGVLEFVLKAAAV